MDTIIDLDYEDRAINRFMSRVIIPDNPMDCWVWIGCFGTTGYGTIHYHGKNPGAHQFIYAWICGPVPPGWCVMHSCDNRWCVNPYHLSAGTLADNNHDMIKKGRAVYLVGENIPKHVLTEDLVRKIREKYRAGVRPTELAQEFGIGYGTAWQVTHGVTWRHLL